MVAMSTRNQRASGGGQSTAATRAFRWFAEESSRGTAKLPSLNAATKVAKAAKGAEVVKESTRFLAAVGGQREGSEDSLSISQRRRRLSQARRRPLDCCASQLVENDSDGSVGKRET
eukprot:CAMPEP_0171523510 /NCGR_PEP_ID=MMETSP0959-20130129/8460_1 /TAXON_ID=87120 /ORGANISM="Aurantiochytrium limacinum, Strain ATCCMYA-1381" /LENGTH=116 /DNA_ID=CAMNT_0012063995 /DNA_START=41 /DNA_END=391 /DNA_ORIENTATION=-